MDVTGVFGYSDEDGTEAASYDDKLDEDEIRARTEHVSSLVEELTAQRAEERIGEEVVVLVEEVTAEVGGRPCRAPGAGGRRRTDCADRAGAPWVGDIVRARVVGTEGVDLVAVPCDASDRAGSDSDREAEQLQPAQRADHAADRAGAVLRCRAAHPGRRLDRVAAAPRSRSSWSR